MTIVALLLLMSAWITFVAVCSAGFCALVAVGIVWRYGVKLREYKPKAFVIDDIASGVYKLVQATDGSFELQPRAEAPESAEESDKEEDVFEWYYGSRK